MLSARVTVYLTGRKRMNVCTQIKQKHFGNFASSYERAFFSRLKASYSSQALLILIIKNILQFLPKTDCVSLPAFGCLHWALQFGGFASSWVFRKPSPGLNFEKHCPYFRSSITPVSFLRFPHKKSFHLMSLARLLWRDFLHYFLPSLPYRRMKAHFRNLAENVNPALPQCPSHEPFLIPSKAPVHKPQIYMKLRA